MSEDAGSTAVPILPRSLTLAAVEDTESTTWWVVKLVVGPFGAASAVLAHVLTGANGACMVLHVAIQIDSISMLPSPFIIMRVPGASNWRLESASWPLA